MAGGRPTDYSADIIKKAQKYLDDCVDERVIVYAGRGKRRYQVEGHLKVRIPTIEGLAVYLGISRETVYAWEKDPSKKEFSDILAQLRAEQADRLVNSGLSGDYNPTIAKVLLTKHGYREGHEHTGADGAGLFQPSKEEQDKVDQALDELDGAGKGNSKKR